MVFESLNSLMGLGISFLVIFLAMYVYAALALQTIAKRLNNEKAWLAWIPIANIYLITQLVGIPGWWTLIVFAQIIPFVGALAFLGVMGWILWLLAEKLNHPGWMGLLLLVPVVNLVVLWMLAWGSK